MEWVEAQGKTVDAAIEAALAELGLTARDQASVEVIQEPTPGFLGLGGKEAIVKVSPKRRRSRPRRRRSGKGDGTDRAETGAGRGDGGGRQQQQQGAQPAKGRGNRNSNRNGNGRNRGGRSGGGEQKPRREDRPPSAPIEEQADVAKEFLVGLLDAFGLEGSVETRVEDDILWIDVTGPQTEAFIGAKGVVLQSIHELTRTVVQRKTFGAPRMRLDIAGYTERRREALRIYTQRLAEQLLANGGEIMLEPMPAPDRKVVHDTVVDIEGIRSFSEGEDPDRAVVLALEDGYAASVVVVADDDEDVVVVEPVPGEEE